MNLKTFDVKNEEKITTIKDEEDPLTQNYLMC